VALTKVRGAGLGTLDDNITFSTAGKGVHLGVTSATSSNLMDDYEEGTWTPALSDGSNNASVDSTTTGGHYTKIGRNVFVTAHLLLTSKGSLSGNIEITGLPFSTKADSNFHNRGGGSVGRVDNLARNDDGEGIYISIEPDTTSLFPFIDDNTNENQRMADNTIDATFRLFFSATYVT
jgi:hypothetical protein